MQTVTTIGLDIAKSVFQIHGVDAQGGVVCVPKTSSDDLFYFGRPVPADRYWPYRWVLAPFDPSTT
jgi:transposase